MSSFDHVLGVLIHNQGREFLAGSVEIDKLLDSTGIKFFPNKDSGNDLIELEPDDLLFRLNLFC